MHCNVELADGIEYCCFPPVNDICEASTTQSYYEEDEEEHPMEKYNLSGLTLSYFSLMDQYKEIKAENEKLKMEINSLKRKEEQKNRNIIKRIKTSGAYGTKFMKEL